MALSLAEVSQTTSTVLRMKIGDLKGLDWKKVCSVKAYRDEWRYTDIDQNVMFSPHRSWVYAITVDKEIVKIGETGNPLGIKPRYDYELSEVHLQPIIGTKCRLGRYRKGGESDQIVRESLRKETRNGSVEIYAYMCPEAVIDLVIIDQELPVSAQIHKQLEKMILDRIKKIDGCYPALNTGRY